MKSIGRLAGIFAVLKPPGLTSAETCNRIRNDLLKEAGFKGKISQSELKIGHGGTLDSYATGVLPIGLGSGCQLIGKLLHSDKQYSCRAVLGIETDTGALNGNTIRQMACDHVTHCLVTATVQSFVGQIVQVPPVYSALKCNGRRLSDYARAGEPIPANKLVGRRIVVHRIACTDFHLPYVSFDVECGSGCYIRSLVRDVGAAMNTCASVVSLERTMHGFFTREMCVPAYEWTIDSVRRAITCSQIVLERQLLLNRQNNR